MKILLLNSDIDNFIITLIVGATASIFILKWAKDKLKSRKPLLSSFFENEIEDQLENYTFNFESRIMSTKPFSIKTRIIAFLISLIIIVLPLYEMIETLRPEEVFYGFSCFPSL